MSVDAMCGLTEGGMDMNVFVCLKKDGYGDFFAEKVFSDEERAREWLRDEFIAYKGLHPTVQLNDYTWVCNDEKGEWEWYDTVSDFPYGDCLVVRKPIL